MVQKKYITYIEKAYDVTSPAQILLVNSMVKKQHDQIK